MREVSLKEYVEKQANLKKELSRGFMPVRVADCDSCYKPRKVSLLNDEWLCKECWKNEKAMIEGRLARTGPVRGVGNSRPALLRDAIDYHGTGSVEMNERKRKGEK